VERGYRIIRLYEFYEYQVTRYVQASGDGGHFAGYIDTFLKLKAEASGYPGWVRNPEDQGNYVEQFRVSEGIDLDKSAIRKKAAKRGLAKLCLNSFWGILTECDNRTRSMMATEPRELYRFLAAPDVEVTDVLFANDDAVWVKWKYANKEQEIPLLRHTNNVIGAYVTTGARLNLYSYLDVLKEKAVYCDTESVTYVQDSGRPPAVTCGDKLGDMVDELEQDEYIEEFVSGDPKKYAYRIANVWTREKKTVCKVRGITLNYATALLLNFDRMRGKMPGIAPEDVITVHTERKIKRKTRKYVGTGLLGTDAVALVSEPVSKVYQVSFSNADAWTV
jgi:hypothetical protein